jgi:polyhydroxybutyrate depolymerase
MEKLTEGKFNRIADRDGAIIVYPDGLGRGWNDGRTDLKSKAVAEQVDDIGFLRALPRKISSQFPVDTTRVFATGRSNGGPMSYRLACDAADVFAAVAPVAWTRTPVTVPRWSNIPPAAPTVPM